RGYWAHLIHPNRRGWKPGDKTQKRPVGEAWGAERWSEDKLKRTAQDFPGAGTGLSLGPERAPGGGWLADPESHGAEGVESLRTLLGGEDLDTPAWDAARGGHLLVTVDGERLLRLLSAAKAVEGRGPGKVGTYKLARLPGLEIRLGGRKADGTIK